MEHSEQPATGADASLSDAEIVVRILEGDRGLFELLMRRHNRRVYRAIRSVLRDDPEAEDTMQEAYVSAYLHLRDFHGQSAFATWLTRIALNAALMRRRGKSRLVLVDADLADGASAMPLSQPIPDAERRAAAREAASLMEVAVDSLPQLYRTVFMLREVEELDTAETAEVLEVSPEVVKTRLHRAKAALRERLLELAGAGTAEAFGFEAPRCNRVVDAVMERIRHLR